MVMMLLMSMSMDTEREWVHWKRAEIGCEPSRIQAREISENVYCGVQHGVTRLGEATDNQTELADDLVNREGGRIGNGGADGGSRGLWMNRKLLWNRGIKTLRYAQLAKGRKGGVSVRREEGGGWYDEAFEQLKERQLVRMADWFYNSEVREVLWDI